MEVLTAIQRRRVILHAIDFRDKAHGPARLSHLFKDLRQDAPQRLQGRRVIQQHPHLRIRRHALDAEEPLQIGLPRVLLHPLLELQQVRMLKKEHGKSAHQHVVQLPRNASRITRIRHLPEPCAQEVPEGFKG
ncbi:MAG: hypothetical protein ACREBD_14360 [Blastocatellia bacterium]